MASICFVKSLSALLCPLKAVCPTPLRVLAAPAANPIFVNNGNAAKNGGIVFYFTVRGLSVKRAETSAKFTKLFAPDF